MTNFKRRAGGERGVTVALRANLFDKPVVDFWYPPFAAQQPRWTDGQLIVDLAQAADKEMAVLNIVPEGAKSGQAYTFSFMAQADREAPLIVNVPQAKAPGDKTPKSDWAQHSAQPTRRSITFIYQPELMEQKNITFFWDKAAIATKTVWKFSDFSLTPATESEANAPAAAPMGDGPMTVQLPAEGGPFEAKFWYPPYANAQPVVEGGKMTVDLKQAAGKELAVLELSLPKGMTPDATYILKFQAASTPDGALVVLVPEPNPAGDKDGDKFRPRSDWAMHGANPKMRVIEFVYRSTLVSSGDKITLFWDKAQIDSKTVWTLSDFSLKKVD